MIKRFIKLTSDKKVRLKDLRTTLKANCIVLKREYKLAKIMKDDSALNKILKKAFAACKKGFEQIKGRSAGIKTKRVKKLLQTTSKIYKGSNWLAKPMLLCNFSFRCSKGRRQYKCLHHIADSYKTTNSNIEISTKDSPIRKEWYKVQAR